MEIIDYVITGVIIFGVVTLSGYVGMLYVDALSDYPNDFDPDDWP
jgi:hypothetical protein